MYLSQWKNKRLNRGKLSMSARGEKSKNNLELSLVLLCKKSLLRL